MAVNVKNVKFHKYNSIENHYSKKMLTKIREVLHLSNSENVLWEATEKVHGAHLAITIMRDPENNSKILLKAARRNGWLEWGESFYNFQTILERDRQKFETLYNNLISNYNIDQIIIHGEIFGGSYPGIKDDKALRVQKGISYTPHNEFYAFDIHNGKFYFNPELAQKFFEDSKILCAKPLFSGTLDEVLQFNNTFESTLPKILGFPSPGEDNLAEGLVLKPRRTLYFATGSRIILKSKTAKFSEIQKSTPKKITSIAPIETEDYTKVLEALREYLTENRFDAVKSKHPCDIRGPKLLGALVQDALKDFQLSHEDPELPKLFSQMPKKKKRRMMDQISKDCMQFIC